MDRKTRERAEREQRIITAARTIAESEGWDAVTVRRLAGAIEFSQPVLYSHFASRAAVISAVAVEGFRELATELRNSSKRSSDRQRGRENGAASYLAFARRNPRLYEAMFSMPTELRFAEADTRQELRDAFAALADVVAPLEGDVDLVTETFWATLHGLAELERSGRIRLSAHRDRVTLAVRALSCF